VGLAAAATKPYRQYSLGMKQRLGLAAALLRPRELLVLDEPTNGLDPQGTREVRLLIRELADAGSTVLVSSHLLSEIEQVCSHIGIMGRGRLLLQGDRSVLTARGTAHLVVTTTLRNLSTAAEVLAAAEITEVTVDGMTLTGLLADVAPERVAAALVHAGVDLLGFEVRRPSLEQLFVALTGEGFDVAR
jgi:ABC-type multidrug transport system ATPase subunit